MANIRKKFKGAASCGIRVLVSENISQTEIWMATRKRSGLHRLECLVMTIFFFPFRYVAKIIFSYILGYKIDVGHMEAVNLISSSKYSEKQIVRSSVREDAAIIQSFESRVIWLLPY